MYIFGIILFGLASRLVSINQSLWLDEGTTALVAKMSISDIFAKFLPGDFHPPFYYLLLKFWTSLFGFSEVSLRIPSVVFGLGTIYVTYLIAKKLFNNRVGLFAAGFTATSGLLLYYSQEARMYALAAFLVTLLIYLFLKRSWFLFSIVLAVLSMTDYVALLILPVFWLMGIKDWKKLAISHIPMLAVFTIYFPIFQKQLSAGFSQEGSGWWNLLGPVTFKNSALIPVKFMLGRISFDDKFIYTVVVLITSAIFGLILYKVRKTSIFLWAWLALPILLGLVISFKIPTLSYFRFLFCLPALYLLMASGLNKFDKHKNIFLVLVLAVNLLSSGYYLFNPRFHREDWGGLVRFVESQRSPNSVTLFVTNSNTEAYRYYAPNAKIAGPEALRLGYDQVWLMRYLQEVFDPADKVRQKVENLGYSRAAQYSFNGVQVWKYKK